VRGPGHKHRYLKISGMKRKAAYMSKDRAGEARNILAKIYCCVDTLAKYTHNKHMYS
jgi:hypothetical protein